MTWAYAGRILLLLSLLVLNPLQGQDYQHLAPKPVPPQPTSGTSTPPPPAPAPESHPQEVLVQKLTGLVFVPTQQEVVAEGLHSLPQPILVKDLIVPDLPAFTRLLTPYIGQPLTRGKLDEILSAVIVYFRTHDRPLVDVLPAPQDITSGVVQIVVLQGRAGKITVEGNRWVSSSEIRNDFRLQPGDEVRQSQLNTDRAWANQNPFHSTDIVYRPGANPGETDIILQTQDRFPVRFYVGYEDTGNAATGFDRYEAGFNWGDAFNLGLGQQVNYQYTTSGDGTSIRAHTGSYVIPLPWRHTLQFFGSYVDTKGTIPPVLNLTGRSYQLSGRYLIPLPAIGKYTSSTGFGYDYKYNNNSLEFGTTAVSGTINDVDQLVWTYDGSMPDHFGVTSISNNFYWSPGDLGGHNSNADFNAAHPGAKSHYLYDNMTLQRLTRLPGDWSLLLRGTLQVSDANLIPSEQLGLGGYDSVRGYDEREVNTDEGYFFTTELRTPSISLGQLFGHAEFKDQLQFLTFWDYGVGSNYRLLPGEQSEYLLSSIGCGVRYNISSYLSVRSDFGVQMLRTGLDKDGGSRADLGLTLSY